MALKTQASFSSGELDPALHERITLERYRSSLKTGRNAIIGKTGRLISPPAREQLTTCKTANRTCLLYVLSTGILLEFGHQYVRFHGINATNYLELSHDITESLLQYVRFEASGNYLYIFCNTKAVKKIDLNPIESFMSNIFDNGSFTPTNVSAAATGTGYAVDYQFTSVINGEESLILQYGTGGGILLPINAGEKNDFVNKVGTTSQKIQEMRVYRRPDGAGAFGYIGSSTAFSTSGGDRRAKFSDVGQAADYTRQPPTLNIRDASAVATLLSPVGTVYQQRLLLGSSINTEAIEASRPGLQNNFYRDYPLSSDSALSFKCGTSGKATVLRMIDSDGLVVFTTAGVYLSAGALGPSNLSLDRKGNWVIDERVPPIGIPGGVLFIDKMTNTVRSLTWSTESASYSGDELSIFSDHLFLEKRVVSWAFQQSATPVLWVVFDDGSYSSFTYEPMQSMRAWMRHDSCNDDVTVEYVASAVGTESALPNNFRTFFLVNKGGTRYIETVLQRYLTAYDYDLNSEAYLKLPNFPMHAAVSKGNVLVGSLVTGTIALTADVPGDWDGVLTATANTGVWSSGDVGKIYRFFHPVDRTVIDLEVVAYTNSTHVKLQPDSTFPSAYAASPCRLYETYTTITGLGHLNGEAVSVVVDGEVIASPFNNDQDYETCTPSGGSLTLPNGIRGAFIHVGRPICSDIETLDVDTVEQRPTQIESKTVNKVYIKTHKARGLYVGNKFPDDNLVGGMQPLEDFITDEDEEDNVSTAIPQGRSERAEITLPGDWQSQGRVCIRQVDPIHWEILSITTDLHDLRR